METDEKQDTKEVPVVEEEEENFIEPLQHLVKHNIEPFCRKVLKYRINSKNLVHFLKIQQYMTLLILRKSLFQDLSKMPSTASKESKFWNYLSQSF